MRLLALKDIPTSVNMIPKGQEFIEQDDTRAGDWISQGYAVQLIGPPSKALPPPLPAAVTAAMQASPQFALVWEGCTVAVIASGPSLTEEQCAAVREWRAANPLARVVAINTSFRRAPFADVLYACDGNWWRTEDPVTKMTYFAEASEHFDPSSMWTQDAEAAQDFGLNFIRSKAGNRISTSKSLICQGANSTIQAMNLAFHAGAKRFILLGVDLRGRHWHADHPAPLAQGLPHRMWQENFAQFAESLVAEKVEVVNCSPGTALTAFPRAKLAEELAK